jgi:isocitrate dehydrogenase
LRLGRTKFDVTMTNNASIIYTLTDEAPALATRSLLPIVEAFASAAGVSVETRDISLAGRILANFNDWLSPEQYTPDALAELGELAKTPEANIIKLPNVSASVPQLKAAVAELQGQGYALPEYPDDPANDDEQAIRGRYDKVLGSAVNPVLREGNSDRRAPAAVKKYAQANPHSMGAWSAESASHVVTMSHGDFRHNEQSATVAQATAARIEFVGVNGTEVLKEVPLLDGEVIDGTFMSKSALDAFLAAQVDDARESGVLFSLHMKATMMKISDPIIFGHGVRAYFSELFETYGQALAEIGADPNNGLGNVIGALDDLDADTSAAIKAAIAAAYERGPALAMVDSDRGITNLHVPSDVIIDASMPAMIRTSGQMWNAAGELQDVKAVIPDSSYADLYSATFDHCKAHGAFNPVTMGTVPNVGLMAQKAEEYGSHDKTFEIEETGTMRIVDGDGNVLTSHQVEPGDIWRACQVKDLPVQDWVKLAVNRARSTGWPTIFWLDAERAHDAQLIQKVEYYLGEHDTSGLDIRIMNVADASVFSLERARAGENTVSVTGNVLRDYLTDLFPILELGTSAKMLSIVPLMNGGGLFETGAGGSAPKHVQQFEKENHLRWDSLGEFLALSVSLDHLGEVFDNLAARMLGDTLDAATEQVLLNRKSPSRKVDELDNRGSHFYLAMYWAKALADQVDNDEVAAKFAPLAAALAEHETIIVEELNAVQGQPMDIGGYYAPNEELAVAAMRPSQTLNSLLSDFIA